MRRLLLSLQSLHARLILLTLGTILLVQAATLATVNYYREKLTQDVTVQVVATTIRTVRAALATVPADERAKFVRQASHNEWHLWSRAIARERREVRLAGERHQGQPGWPASHHDARTELPPSPLPRDMRRDLRLFINELNAKLNDGTRVGLSRGPVPRLYISLIPDSPTASADPIDEEQARDNREWLVIPLDRITPPVATPIILVWLSGMGLLLLISAAFSWHITRPITKLVKATDQLAAGQPQRVVPSGPSEIRALGERFNAMLDTMAESNAVRHTLLAGLPHDLKGPLSRMWLRIEMIDDSTFKEGIRQDIQDMQRMVDQFIGFVRGTDPTTYRFAPIDLATWLDERVGAWESAGSEVRLVKTLPPPLPVNADRIALGRLLDNLITNALNHAAPPVEIALDADSENAIIVIEDHGPGIPADRRAEALRPFSRLDTARTRTGSVGLGLALANAIAGAHGGTLALGDSSSGGLKITITLPRADQPRNRGGDGGLDKPNIRQ
jgi:two-component system osmolarity sensor histidine kinase EnvZ